MMYPDNRPNAIETVIVDLARAILHSETVVLSSGVTAIPLDVFCRAYAYYCHHGELATRDEVTRITQGMQS